MDSKIKVSQVSRESDAWKRTLAFLSQESSFLQLRLAEILNKNAVTSDFLEAAESYQNCFVQKDEIIKLLLHDVSELDKLLTREAHENGVLIKAVVFKQKHLRRQVDFLEREFNKLKVQFNDYLSELE